MKIKADLSQRPEVAAVEVSNGTIETSLEDHQAAEQAMVPTM